MASSVSPQFLLEGAVYALEQCGLLLRDANVLYRAGSHATTVIVTAFASEELGRSAILFEMRREVLTGKEITKEQIADRCSDHVIKQQRGTLSAVLTAPRDTELGKLIRARIAPDPQRIAEWEEAGAKLARIRKVRNKRIPSDRHEIRKSALYVEPTKKGWNRPAETSRAFAHRFLQEAVNDYATRCDNLRPELLKLGEPIGNSELHAALQQWSDRPELPRPEWPQSPAP